MNSKDFLVHISVAAKKRQPLFKECLQTFRLFDGTEDGIPELFVDKYNNVAVVHIFEGSPLEKSKDRITTSLIKEIFRTEREQLLKLWGVGGVALKKHSGDAKGDSNNSEDNIIGKVPEITIIEEWGLKYLIRPRANINPGLFVDTRHLRKELIEQSVGKRVLNTFCYTGALGLAAAFEKESGKEREKESGVDEVTQIDISATTLKWAKENYELNKDNIGANIRFIKEDTIKFLKREIRRKERSVTKDDAGYDLIILDPPTFGSSDGVTFKLSRDLGVIIDLAVQLLNEKSSLLVTCNKIDITAKNIKKLVEETINNHSLKMPSFRYIHPPLIDFPSHERSPVVRGVWVDVLTS